MSKKFTMLSCFIVICTIFLTSGQVYSQQLDSKGNEFIFSFLPNNFDAEACEIYLSSETATDVTVEYPVNSPTFTTTVSLTPGDVTVVTIPPEAANSWNDGQNPNNAVRVFSAFGIEFSCVMANLKTNTSDAALAFPVDVLGSEYIVVTYHTQSNFNIDGARSEFIITAVEDNTTLTIIPKVDMFGTGSVLYPAGTPFNFTLNRGESFYGRDTYLSSPGSFPGLAGTTVQSDKPIAVVNGNKSTTVPVSAIQSGGASHLFEMAIPTAYWSSDVHLPSLGFVSSAVRVFASQDNTEVRRHPGAPFFLGTLDRGDYLDTGIFNGSTNVISGTNPVQVIQFSRTILSGTNNSAPSMSSLIPVEQYDNRYTFRTIGDGRFSQHYVRIVANGRDVGTLTLDGVPVPESEFVIFPDFIGNSSEQCLYAAWLPISEGVHQTNSARGHWVSVIGVDSTLDAYSYHAGAWFNRPPVNDAYDPDASFVINGATAFFNAVDSISEDINENLILDSGEDLNSDGVLNIESGIMSISLALPTNLSINVPVFKGGKESVDFTVSLIDSCIPGSGNVLLRDCAGKTVFIPVEIPAVVCPNNPPMCSINPPGPFNVNPGQQVTFTASASDLNVDDQITLDVSSLPSGATMNPALPFSGSGSGISSDFNWIPNSSQGGFYRVTYSVTDDNNTTYTCLIDINVNSQPICGFFPDPGPITVTEGDTISLFVFGEDPNESDQITLDVVNLPAGATMNPSLPQIGDGEDGVASQFSWIPAIGQAGSYAITYSVADEHGLVSQCTLDITVNSLSGNNPPIAICQNVTTPAENNCEGVVTPEQVDNGSHDPDNDPITLSLDPQGPYPAGTTTVTLIVTDNMGSTGSCTAEITVTGGTGTISGTVGVSSNGLAGVTVKLLEGADPTVVVDEQITGSLGDYSFGNVQVGTYQVMIVEPLGYAVNQNFISSDLACEATNTVDFQVAEIVLVNEARSKGYWKHQFDVYVNERGSAQESEADLEDYLVEVANRYNAHFDYFFEATNGVDDFEDWQSILSVKNNAEMEAKAVSQLAALLLNMISLKIGQYEEVTADGRSAGDVLTYVSNLLDDTDTLNDETAKDLAEQVNLQQTIDSGIVPEGGILYKGGKGSSIEWGFGTPTEYALFQNYPNPFNPSTTISWQSPVSGWQTLKVYDLLGREVATLVNEYKPAGSYEVEWDASDLPSGIYIYQLKTENFTSMKKMILLK
jgi:hypothetical protein